MYSFRNDYNESAHPRILQALLDTNMEQDEGYGLDKHSLQAMEYMKKAMEDTEVDIHFIPGGTHTNLLAAAAFLRPIDGVLSAASGHIYVHETGSVEATGHRVMAVDTTDGKLTVCHLEKMYAESDFEHMPTPRMVYLSNSTELGTVYTKAELEAISAFCRKKGMLLFIDGARMGSALCSKGSGLTFADYPRLADAFYVGGTKNGALLGEALVIKNPALKGDFRRHLKQRGAMLAKGRVLGVQFEELFKDGLFFQLAEHANRLAERLSAGIKALGYSFLVESPSNQLFPILPVTVLAQLEKDYDYSFWGVVDEKHHAIRLVTSWATDEAQVEAFLERLKALSK